MYVINIWIIHGGKYLMAYFEDFETLAWRALPHKAFLPLLSAAACRFRFDVDVMKFLECGAYAWNKQERSSAEYRSSLGFGVALELKHWQSEGRQGLLWTFGMCPRPAHDFCLFVCLFVCLCVCMHVCVLGVVAQKMHSHWRPGKLEHIYRHVLVSEKFCDLKSPWFTSCKYCLRK